VFLVEYEIFSMGLPAGYMFSWEREKQTRTRHSNIRLLRGKSYGKSRAENRLWQQLCLNQIYQFTCLCVRSQ